jgi:Helix-turn-helix domain
MRIVKAYKYRLKTNQEIEHKLAQFCGATRFVWNKFLANTLEIFSRIWFFERKPLASFATKA